MLPAAPTCGNGPQPGVFWRTFVAVTPRLPRVARFLPAPHLPTLADGGYKRGGAHPIRQPAYGRASTWTTAPCNALLRGLRCLGERGCAILVDRWRALRHFTCSPEKIGTIVTAALVLTHFESNTAARNESR